jgi:hypothetical protein
MQLALPLAGLTAPPPLAWEHVDPARRVDAVAVLARLMARVVQAATEEEQPDD